MSLSRRSLLRLAALGAGLGVAPKGLAGGGGPSTADGAKSSAGDQRSWRLLEPVAAGADLGSGWRAKAIGPLELGTVVLLLEGGGSRGAKVRICRNSGSPVGVAHSADLDFVLVNGGNGDVPTEESLASAILALAETVGRREREGGNPPASLRLLVTHREWMELSSRDSGSHV